MIRLANIQVDFVEKGDIREVTVTLRVLGVSVGDVLGEVGKIIEKHAME